MKKRLKLKDLEVSSFITHLPNAEVKKELGATGGCTTVGTTLTLTSATTLSLTVSATTNTSRDDGSYMDCLSTAV